MKNFPACSVRPNVTLILLFLFTETVVTVAMMCYTRQYIIMLSTFILIRLRRQQLIISSSTNICHLPILSNTRTCVYSYIHTYIYIPRRFSALHIYCLTTTSPPSKRNYNVIEKLIYYETDLCRYYVHRYYWHT